MPAMLNDKKADLVTGGDAVRAQPAAQRRSASPLFDQTEGIGAIAVHRSGRRANRCIDKNRAALVDFLEDMLRIERWYLDPKNHDEATQIAGKLLKLPPERFGWLFTKKDYYRDPGHDAGPRRRCSATSTSPWSSASIKSNFDVKKHSDLSLIEEAAKRLKCARFDA